MVLLIYKLTKKFPKDELFGSNESVWEELSFQLLQTSPKALVVVPTGRNLFFTQEL